MSLLSFALFMRKFQVPLATRGTDFRHFTATDARFGFRKFTRIKKQVWVKKKKRTLPRF